jgi:diguanylate cyclase
MDALIVGCWISLMHWSLLPSICIMAISVAALYRFEAPLAAF